jgi:hypothetical protein
MVERLPHKKTGKVYSSSYFQTFCLPCFKELFELFYPYGPKVVPSSIGELLTPLSLAYWICDDGKFHKKGPGIILCTDSYSLDEVKLLTEVLVNKFKLDCTFYSHGTGHRIRINKKSVPFC